MRGVEVKIIGFVVVDVVGVLTTDLAIVETVAGDFTVPLTDATTVVALAAVELADVGV